VITLYQALQAGPHGNAAEVGVIKDLVFLTARPQLIEAFTHATLTSTGVMTNVLSGKSEVFSSFSLSLLPLCLLYSVLLLMLVFAFGGGHL